MNRDFRTLIGGLPLLLIGLSHRRPGPPLIRLKEVEPAPIAKCGNPDCAVPTSLGFCSADCCRHFKANFQAVDGRNVRIGPPPAEILERAG